MKQSRNLQITISNHVTQIFKIISKAHIWENYLEFKKVEKCI